MRAAEMLNVRLILRSTSLTLAPQFTFFTCALVLTRGKQNKAYQKDVDARWTIKIGGKIRYRPDGTPLP